MASTGMISCVAWVPKGAAKTPESAPIDEAELAALRQEAKAMAAGVLAGSEGWA